MTCFVAFGNPPKLQPLQAGSYLKEPPPADLRAYFKARGGFWSLVGGQHAVLVCMKALKTTVMDIKNLPPDKESKHPGRPAIGDEVVVVIPPDGFTELSDERVDDMGYYNETVRYVYDVPTPRCKLEMWTRLT